MVISGEAPEIGCKITLSQREQHVRNEKMTVSCLCWTNKLAEKLFGQVAEEPFSWKGLKNISDLINFLLTITGPCE